MSTTKWKYKNKLFKGDLEGNFGFVYIITNKINNSYYIGCKQLVSHSNAKVSKKRASELYTGVGRKPTRERKVKESDWSTYKGSSKSLKESILEYGEENFTYTILHFFKTKQEMLLTEAKLIIETFLKKDPLVLNQWVSLKMYKSKL